MTPECLESVYNMPVEIQDYQGIKVVIPIPEDIYGGGEAV